MGVSAASSFSTEEEKNKIQITKSLKICWLLYPSSFEAFICRGIKGRIFPFSFVADLTNSVLLKDFNRLIKGHNSSKRDG